MGSIHYSLFTLPYNPQPAVGHGLGLGLGSGRATKHRAGAIRHILNAEVGLFGPLGVPEVILVFVVALLLFGPRKMPQIGRSLGRALGEFRRASNDFKRTIEDEVAAEDIREVQRDLQEIRSVGRDVLKDTAGITDTTAPTTATPDTKEQESK